MVKVLGIESSCDDTAASVVEDGRVLSDVIAGQATVHSPYGGVVPELAGRNHLLNIMPVVDKALEDAGVDLDDIQGIAVTRGPGLVGSLVVGLQFAKTLAAARNLPFVGVNHLRGHLLAARIEGDDLPLPEFPYMALLASGGHTGIYLVENEMEITCLGQTRDDAAGEAFDKVARLLGLGYPGGPLIDLMAESQGSKEQFPQSLRQRKSFEFSFSGIKTSVAQRVAQIPGGPDPDQVLAIVRGFQQAVVEILVRKITLAARSKQISTVVLSGGVAANKGLRKHAREVCERNDLELFAPPPERCTDNGSMIAYAGYLALRAGQRDSLDLAPLAGWPL